MPFQEIMRVAPSECGVVLEEARVYEAQEAAQSARRDSARAGHGLAIGTEPAHRSDQIAAVYGLIMRQRDVDRLVAGLIDQTHDERQRETRKRRRGMGSACLGIAEGVDEDHGPVRLGRVAHVTAIETRYGHTHHVERLVVRRAAVDIDEIADVGIWLFGG